MTTLASLFDGHTLQPQRVWAFGHLRPFEADFIMADPPWRWQAYSDKGLEKSPESHYETMTISDICALPVGDLAACDCLLWLWARAPMLPEALRVLDAWGFRFVTEGVWLKRSKHDKRHMGTGYVLRGEHEPFILAKRGEPKVKAVRSVIVGKVREHSRKPDEAYSAAEIMMPNARRYDLFSRQSRQGWESWGDEAGKFDGVAA